MLAVILLKLLDYLMYDYSYLCGLTTVFSSFSTVKALCKGKGLEFRTFCYLILHILSIKVFKLHDALVPPALDQIQIPACTVWSHNHLLLLITVSLHHPHVHDTQSCTQLGGKSGVWLNRAT